MKTNLKAFKDHSRNFENFSVVYPVISRRAGGLSLGINLNPDGACNYKCVYCQVPRHELGASPDPAPKRVLEELDLLYSDIQSGDFFNHPRFKDTPPEMRNIMDISISGDGEPSLYPHLKNLLEEVLDRAKSWGVSLQIISNGAGLMKKELQSPLSAFRPELDRIWLKADAWNQKDMSEIYQSKLNYSKHKAFLEQILSSYSCWLQVCVFSRDEQIFSSENPERISETLALWSEKFPLFEKTQVYTLARQTFVDGVSALEDDALKTWCRSLSHRLDKPVLAYGEKGLLDF